MTLRQPPRPATQRSYRAAQPSPRSRPALSVHRDRDAQNRPAPDMNAWAKHLMTVGFEVVPLAPSKRGVDRTGKNPLTAHGVHDATNDFEAFRRLVGSATNFNIGVATGSASGVVIDVDPRNGGRRAFAELKRRLGPLPRTLTCLTGGGGLHLYFRLPPGGEMKKKLAPGVDLLAEGRYAVAPPSLHSSGRRYRWAEHRGPRDLAIASLPDSWLAFISSDSQARNEPAAADGEAILEGSRNTELTRIAGQLRRAGLSEDELSAPLRGVNAARCRPPLDDGEVAQIARNVARYPAVAEPRDEGQKIAQALLDAEFSGGRWLRHESDGHFWSWTGTHWAVIPDKILQKKIMTFANSKSSSAKSAKTLVAEVFGLLQIMQADTDDLLHFASEPPNVVNVLNGELWLRDDGTVEARPHDPATGMRHVLNVRYLPAATCPEYDAAVQRIFENADDPRALIAFFEELMGYAIQLRRDIPLIVAMIGSGSNGKTSLVRILTELVGPDFVHSGRVDDLDERFAVGSLFGKLLFVDDDVRAGTKLPDGALKKISEAKRLTGEHKFKPAFSFVNRAFPIMLFNNLPSLADLSHGMMRRLHVVPFDRTFEESEIDRHLFDRIIQNELSGVLNRALKGWKRLKRRKGFSRSADMQRARDELLAHANPLKGFIDECCEADPKGKVTLQAFYDAYRAWATRSGYSMAQVKSTVKKNLLHEGYPIRKRGEGLVVIGLKLREP
jgi:putative DNA primase/helicase